MEKLENRDSINLLNAKNERKQAGGCWKKHICGGQGGTECTATKVTNLCPLVLLVKVFAGKVKC